MVAVPDGLAVLVADTGVRRTLAGSDYNDRPAECRLAAETLGRYLPDVRTLRDVSERDLERYGKALTPELLRRARHAVGECRRVPEGAEALLEDDPETFGAIMRASHESSRDLYQVTIPELDLLAETAWEVEGCYGARLSGAGFGGCVTALVEEQALGTVADRLDNAFAHAFGRSCSTYAVTIAEGAAVIDG